MDSWPPVLCILLTRWVRNAYTPDVYNKENRAVDVPEVLPAFPGGPLQRYLLRAAVIHSGHAGAGHYFCVHQDIDTGTWREANDDQVTVLKDRSTNPGKNE